MVADNPRNQDGSANLTGTSNGKAAELPFGVGSWNNKGQEPYEKLYYDGDMQSYFLHKSGSKIGNYITYRFAVNPADGTYRAYWKFDNDETWNEPFKNSVADGNISYPFKVGNMPEVISKLRFSLFQTWNGGTIEEAKAKSSTYYMDYIKVKQKPLEVTDCKKITSADGKNALSVSFDSVIDETTATSITVKLYKNGNPLTFDADYKVSVTDDSKNMIITLECENADTDIIKLVIEDGINSTSGYSKLLHAYQFSTNSKVCISAVGFKNSAGISINDPADASDGVLTVNALLTL